jgi:hypothetical protein
VKKKEKFKNYTEKIAVKRLFDLENFYVHPRLDFSRLKPLLTAKIEC